MKLWLLQINEEIDGYYPWQDVWSCATAFIVRAETEEQARSIAQGRGLAEVSRYNPHYEEVPAWTDARYSTCEAIGPDGDAEVIMRQ